MGKERFEFIKTKLSDHKLTCQQFFVIQMFDTGSVSNFIMSCTTPLGPLTYARVWHDNSGKGAMGSWFLSHIVIQDIQTGEKSLKLK